MTHKWETLKHRDPEPMVDNPRRKYGPQSGRLVPCREKPAIHGHHPEHEDCPSCRGWVEMAAERRDDYTAEAPRYPEPKTSGQLWYEDNVAGPGRPTWDELSEDAQTIYDNTALFDGC